MAKQKREQVHVVTAKGEHTPGEVVSRNGDGTIDVEIVHQGAKMLITSSPEDKTGVKHDSWHELEPATPATDAEKDQGKENENAGGE